MNVVLDADEEKMPGEHLGSHAYNYTRGIDFSWENRAYISPARQDAKLSASELPAAPTKFFQSTLGFFVIDGAYIHEWDTTSLEWVERDDATGIAL